MLNAIPDTRNEKEMDEIFLAHNEALDSDRKSTTATGETTPPTHDTIGMIVQRTTSICSVKSIASNNKQVCQGEVFVLAGNR